MRQTLYSVVLVVMCLFFRTQAQTFSPYNLFVQSYNQETGLPGPEVYCGAQDHQGFLWFGTRSGVCRYDGVNFSLVLPLSDQLKSWRIESIVSDNEQGVIVSYMNPAEINARRQRFVLNTQTFELKPLAQSYVLPFADTLVNAVYNLNDTALGFLVNAKQKIWHYTPGRGFTKKYSHNKQLAAWKAESRNVNHIFEGSDFLFVNWLSWRTIMVNEDTLVQTPGIEHHSIAAQKNGALLYRFDSINRRIGISLLFEKSGRLTPYPLLGTEVLQYEGSFISRFINCDNDYSTIFQSDHGKTVFYNTEWGLVNVFDNAYFNSSQPVLNHYFRDRSGVYWLCTSKGLTRLIITKRLFRSHFNYSPSFKIGNNSARGIYADNDLLCVNMFDVMAIKRGKDTTLVSKRNNYGLLYTEEGLWNGSFELRYHEFKTGKTEIKARSLNSEIWALYQLKKNEILLGCTNGLGLYSISANTITPITNAAFPRPKFIYKFFRNTSNDLWAVADNGIYVLNELGQIIDYYGQDAGPPRRKLPFSSIRDVYADKAGVYWIATNGQGLCRWNLTTHTFKYFGVENGFLSNVIYAIQEDEFNNLWLSTDYGLVRFNKSNGFIKTYTEKDGITSNEFNRSSQFKDKHGRIYFGGMNGVTSFDPADFARDTAQINFDFRISSMQWFNTRNGELEMILPKYLKSQSLLLNADIDYVTIAFALLDFGRGSPHYAYKIDGFDRQWNSIRENYIRLSNLPAGNYHLLIKAQTSNGYWNKSQIVIPITVIPPFYKTWWFITLLFVAGLLAVGGIIYLRLRQRIHQLQRMNELRVRLASDLHDEVGGLLNKSAMQSELAKEKVDQDVRPILDKIAENCRLAMSSMRDIMWNLDARNDNSSNLVDRIREYAQMMLNEQYDYELDIQGLENKKLRPEVRQSIYLIYKEAVNNIIKHTKGGRVRIRLELADNKVHMVIYNESAFVENEFSTGQGLKNMRMRAEKVKGTFSIVLNNGVEITVIIPV